ncbi:MAG TPA: glycosyl hydrolase 115 family protein [Candidatus Acidoferrales bacterium]|nr:glycosyl hydrolase 115 family protein [Candidatus Acidoferrales bacterium]
MERWSNGSGWNARAGARIQELESRNKETYLSPFATCVLLLASWLVFPQTAFSIGGERYVRFENGRGYFPLVVNGKSAPLCVSSDDFPGVRLILKYFQTDIANVAGTKPEISIDTIPPSKNIVMVGTIGKSPVIDRLISKKKIDVSGVEGEWETSLIQVVNNPYPGVDHALVIAGSDKRGTIYGMFSISERIGVSPWYWWADVSIKQHRDIFILPGRHSDGPPSVRYRGIFLNDEWPDLTNWVAAKYGFATQSENPPVPPGVANYGHEFYERIFELLLRLKANYLWPAMWDNAFNEDDTLNPKLANEYGIVMGTSHQEPMLRAQKEWDRRYLNTIGTWNFAKYPDTLENFWRAGVRRNKDYESIITIGLRGANDTPMAPGGPEANMALLGKIVDLQRRILKEEVNPDVTKVPQLWCPYKEVLDFYNAGFRVPDDVTILWTDDNWGNIRRLPSLEERARIGRAGVYYHFDYHGGPRNYQWINTNPISKIWDQMSLAKKYSADEIWIVNVGHLKGYELPISYFMDLAWNTNRWTDSNIDDYTRLWAEQQFGDEYAKEIADVLAKYTKYNGRRKPELLSPTTYSLVNYQEADNIVADFESITAKAEEIGSKLPEDERDAFCELVLLPTKASEIVNELYVAAGKNELYGEQKRASTNDMAAEVHSLFEADTSLMGYFNRTFARGKWDHFMDQPVLGYTSWNQPQNNNLDAIHLVELSVPDTASMGVAVEGSESAWPGTENDPTLPIFDPFGERQHYIDVFNKGKTPFEYTAEADKPWIKILLPNGKVDKESRIWINIDWSASPKGTSNGIVKINGGNRVVSVNVKINNPSGITRRSLHGFIEGDGCVSIEAAHYTKLTDAGSNRWINVEDYGNTLSGMRATSAADAPAAAPGKNSPCLEYRVFLFDTGKVDVEGIFGSSLNFMPGSGLRYEVSLDDADPQPVELVRENYNAQNGNLDWERSVAHDVRCGHSRFTITEPGYHTLKVWMIDPGVVLEKIVVNLGGVRPSYLGPPESFHRDVANSE